LVSRWVSKYPVRIVALVTLIAAFAFLAVVWQETPM